MEVGVVGPADDLAGLPLLGELHPQRREETCQSLLSRRAAGYADQRTSLTQEPWEPLLQEFASLAGVQDDQLCCLEVIQPGLRANGLRVDLPASNPGGLRQTQVQELASRLTSLFEF